MSATVCAQSPNPEAHSLARLARVLNVQHAFVPNMLAQENPSVIINTGSKQGITNPP